MTETPLNSWMVKTGAEGEFTLRVALLTGGASAVLLENIDSRANPEESQPLWYLEAHLQPPLIWRSTLETRVPNLLFHEATESLAILDSFLTVGLENLRYRDSRLAHLDFLSREEVIGSLLVIQRHLVKALVPEASEVAGMFPPGSGMRWWIYQLAALDTSGRIAQMVKVCPGLFLLGRELIRRSGYSNSLKGAGTDLFGQILAMIAAGRKLPTILDHAVGAWKACVEGKISPEQFQDQRIRIARAGPLVSPATLWEIPCGRICRQDIPDSPQENSIWFEFQQIASGESNPYPWYLEASQRKAWLGFTSRHALSLVKLFDMSADRDLLDAIRVDLGNLLDYVRATGCHPGPKTNPARFLEESGRWHRTVHQQHVAVYLPAQNLLPEDILQTSAIQGFENWRHQDAVVRALGTVGDLAEESKKMEHCVQMFAGMAVQGYLAIFHADIQGEPFTIAVGFNEGKPVLQEASGFRNKRPAPAAQQVIGWWFEDLVAMIKIRKGAPQPPLVGRFEPSETHCPSQALSDPSTSKIAE